MTASQDNDDDEENHCVFSSLLELPCATRVGTCQEPDPAQVIPCRNLIAGTEQQILPGIRRNVTGLVAP